MLSLLLAKCFCVFMSQSGGAGPLCALCVAMLARCLHESMHARRNALGHICQCGWMCSIPSPSGGQGGDGGPLRRDATNFHVGEGAPSLTAAVRDRGGRGDDVLQPVEGDDEQRQQEYQQAEEEPHINVNVARTSW